MLSMRIPAVAFAVALLAVGAVLPIDRALACTGNPLEERLLEADALFEARIVSVRAVPGEASQRIFEFEVTRAFNGVSEGDVIEARGEVRVPGRPVMCPEFPEDAEKLTGWYVVAGLTRDPDRGWTAGVLITPFMGPERSGSTYDEAIAFAEIVSGTNPEFPAIEMHPRSVTCGETVKLRGSKFEAGPYVILAGYANDHAVVAPLDVGPGGTFRVSWAVTCPDWLWPEARYMAMFLVFRGTGPGPGVAGALVGATAGPLLLSSGGVPEPPDTGNGRVEPAAGQQDAGTPWRDVAIAVMALGSLGYARSRWRSRRGSFK